MAVGDVFDRLTVISILSRRTKQGGLITNCQCLCGNTKLVQARHLIGEGTKSCGCLRREGKFGVSPLSLGQAAKNEWWYTLNQNAKTRGYKMELSYEEAQSIGERCCTYCGTSPREVKTKKTTHGGIKRNGIDRVDNNLGYIRGNVVPCCTTCNKAKSTMSQLEFFEWLKRAYYYSNMI